MKYKAYLFLLSQSALGPKDAMYDAKSQIEKEKVSFSDWISDSAKKRNPNPESKTFTVDMLAFVPSSGPSGQLK